MLKDLLEKYKSSGIVLQIITWNVVLFIISLLFFYEFKSVTFNFPNYICFNTKVWMYNIWTIITYGFFHDGPIHLFFNMLSFYFLSIFFFTFFNTNQFKRLYFFGIVISVLFAYFINILLGQMDFIVVGASGAIVMLFFAIATFAPHFRVNLILFTIEIWILAGLYFLIYITLLYSNNGGNLVHLGGAISGFFWGYYMKKGIEITSFMQYIFDIKNIFQKKQNVRKVHINKNSSSISNNSKSSDQTKVDAILDKISKSGYDSLTDDEKKFLFQFKDK